MKIVINDYPIVALGSLNPGDVFSCRDPQYWIVTDTTVGTRVNVVRLIDGLLANLPDDTEVTLLPDAYLKVQ